MGLPGNGGGGGKDKLGAVNGGAGGNGGAIATNGSSGKDGTITKLGKVETYGGGGGGAAAVTLKRANLLVQVALAESERTAKQKGARGECNSRGRCRRRRLFHPCRIWRSHFLRNGGIRNGPGCRFWHFHE